MRCGICSDKGKEAIRVGMDRGVGGLVEQFVNMGLPVYRESENTLIVGPLCKACQKMLNASCKAAFRDNGMKEVAQ